MTPGTIIISSLMICHDFLTNSNNYIKHTRFKITVPSVVFEIIQQNLCDGDDVT